MKPLRVRLQELGRQPVVAAVLSFLFPGLGQAAAGQRSRGLIVSIPMFAVIGAFLLLLIFDRHELLGLAVNQEWLTSLLILDVVALIYHLWAILDSYLVALSLQPRKRRGGPPASAKWAAVFGVVAILSGTVLIHGTVAKVDMDWQHALYCLTAKIPCYFDTTTFDPGASFSYADDNPSPIANASDTPGTSARGSATPVPTYNFSNIPSFSTNVDSQNWDADGELNVVLAGLGVQVGGTAADLGPDTIMVAHIGIKTGQAELISIGRNNYCTPLPSQEIAQNYSTSVNGCPPYTFGPSFFNLPNEILYRCNKWPIPEYAATCGQANDANRYLRAYKGFEMTIGGLLGLHIDGSMWTNPVGLTTLVDALQGVTITVTSKMVDQPCGPSASYATYQLGSLPQFAPIGKPYCPDATHYGYSVPTGPAGVQKMVDQAAASNGGLTVIQVPDSRTSDGIVHHNSQDVAIIIKPGTYHFNGDWALAYARTRIFLQYGDFDRAAHQQVLLKSLKNGLNPCKFASLDAVLPILSAVQAVPYGFNTDLDVTNPTNLQAWANLAKYITGDVQQLVLKPATVGMTGYAWDPNSIAKAKQLVKANFIVAASPSAGAGASSPASACQ